MNRAYAEERRVLVVGADGLRPDLIDPDLMPTVTRLAGTGVRFSDFHSVYPPHTMVAISSLVTGCEPGRHGLVANVMLVPNATEAHVIDTSDWRHLDALDRFSDGMALALPTLADRLAVRGERVAVAGTGSAGATLLWSHRHRARIVNPRTAYGEADLDTPWEKLGPPPERTPGPSPEWADYATRAVTDLFLDDPSNRVVVLWLDELDDAQHRTGLGSPESRAAMATIDRCLDVVLDALLRKGLQEQFDVLFLSDHGHTTVLGRRSLGELLVAARRDLGNPLPPAATAGDFIYANPGSTPPHAAALAPLVAWLQEQPWCDVVLAGHPDLAKIPGVAPLTKLWNHSSHTRAPLLAVAPRWDDARNEHGVPGRVAALTAQPALKSSHGSLASYDLHAVLIASGPSVQEGVVSAIPAGVVDIMPTLLSLLGIAVPGQLDGRVLSEGLRHPPAGSMPAEPWDELMTPMVSAEASTPAIRLHRVGSSAYVHGSEPSIQ